MPKLSTMQAIWFWCKYAPGGCTKGIRSDILACTIITPLAVVITYVCLFSSEYYSQRKFMNVAAAKWTSLSLLVMIVIMLIGYYFWTYSVIRMHARLWYNWWQRTCDVRYIPPSEVQVPLLENRQPLVVSASRENEAILNIERTVDPNNTLVQMVQTNICSKITQTEDFYEDISEHTIATEEFEQNENIV